MSRGGSRNARTRGAGAMVADGVAQLTTDKTCTCNPSDAIAYTSVKISEW